MTELPYQQNLENRKIHETTVISFGDSLDADLENKIKGISSVYDNVSSKDDLIERLDVCIRSVIVFYDSRGFEWVKDYASGIALNHSIFSIIILAGSDEA